MVRETASWNGEPCGRDLKAAKAKGADRGQPNRAEMVAIKWVNSRRDAETHLLEELELSASEVRGEWMRIELDVAMAIFRAE